MDVTLIQIIDPASIDQIVNYQRPDDSRMIGDRQIAVGWFGVDDTGSVFFDTGRAPIDQEMLVGLDSGSVSLNQPFKNSRPGSG